MNKICVVHQSLGGGLFGAVVAAADPHLPRRLASKITWKRLQSGKSADSQLQICNPAQAQTATNVPITSW